MMLERRFSSETHSVSATLHEAHVPFSPRLLARSREVSNWNGKVRGILREHTRQSRVHGDERGDHTRNSSGFVRTGRTRELCRGEEPERHVEHEE